MPETFAIESKNGKGRSFSVYALGYATANGAWRPLSISPERRHRPVFIAYAQTEQECRAFTANLRKGRPFQTKGRFGGRDAELDMPRSAGYRWCYQKAEGGVLIVSAMLPQFFALDSGMLEERIRFVFAPPRWWVIREAAAGRPREEAIASYFAAFLDRRSGMPIIRHPGFHRRLLEAARREPWFQPASGGSTSPGAVYSWPDIAGPAGLEEVALVDVTHEVFEAFLAEQTSRFAAELPAWLEEEPEEAREQLSEIGILQLQGHPLREGTFGAIRIEGGGGLLPDPDAAHTQLRLFDLV